MATSTPPERELPTRLSDTRPPLADWGSRVLAALIDAALALAIVILGFVVGSLLVRFASPALGVLFLFGCYLACFGFIIWQLIVQGQTGQTIGKKLVGIRVLGERDGRVIGAGMSVSRGFIHLLDWASCGLGFLWPLWDAQKQTFTDKIVTTVVIRG